MRVVIVGASVAGLRSLQTLREQGFAGEVVVVGEEPHLPYDRTTLSKAVLKQEYFPALLREETRVSLDADWRLGRRAVALRTDPLAVTLDTGEVVAADGVVIATGVRARELPTLAGAMVLRRIEDCRRLRSLLDGGSRRLTVVGAGLVGAEVAATATEAGHTVTIVEADADPFVRQFGPHLAPRLHALHSERGVDLRVGAGAASATETELTLTSGATLGHDVLVVGVGAVPNVEWLADSGLSISDGVDTDAWGVTSAAGVVAVGDVARYASDRYGRIRTEHWTNARDMPVVAVPALLATLRGEPLGPPYDPVPYFWSQQFGCHIQIAGRPGGGELTYVDGDPEAATFAATEVVDGVPVAALGWNSPKAFGRLRRDLRARH